MDTIDNWLDTINEKEKENNFFYKSPITDIDIEFFYISNKNIITDKKTITYFLSQPNKLNKTFLQIASLLLPLLVWSVICQLKLVSELFLPSPLAVLG